MYKQKTNFKIFSSINFLIYCSVGDKFKNVVKKHVTKLLKMSNNKGKRKLWLCSVAVVYLVSFGGVSKN